MTHSTKFNWHGWFNKARPRILIWYLLLTIFSSVTSILATRYIFYERIHAQSKAYVLRQVEEFRQLASEQTSNSSRANREEITNLFDAFLSKYKPLDSDDYAIALVQGRVYQYTNLFPQTLLTQDAELIQQWGQLTQFQQGVVSTSVGKLYYMAEPVKFDGRTQGVLAIVHCADSIYQLVDGAILLIVPATLGVLGVAAAIAWATAGRVLSPLQTLTETAQSITESDMSQRIPVEGTDEIAKLTITFNQMLDRLQFAFASQREFLKDAGHELRTPITVIWGYLETLKYRPQHQEQTILLAIDELARMSRLVNDLLLLAKAEHSDFLILKPEELDWLTEELYLKVRSLANRNWKLESKGLTPIRLDRQRLTQAMMNLVQNAIRHTQEGDTIAIGSSVRENQARLWVSDTGEGILPEDQQRIFERFARATTCDCQFEGYGLGLSIVQAIAQAHGGRVELFSQPRQGSTFTIVIPLSTQDSAINESDSHHRRQSSHHRFPEVWVSGTRLHDHRR
ncbi:HAMP domain-containing histidine kinase [Gloeocapsopsis crepidinum LEGE 06123]|uniref:histidine kinase n=1 Tax=Gloeocapsopsis crepidinum LEGE 06123 TaxID=588587 RepID=A0ABR9UZ20_9CHRO|nr:HAMP domain-containing histidine kinase [Gloeocapsopsis crepidinum LEGE 06123]